MLTLCKWILEAERCELCNNRSNDMIILSLFGNPLSNPVIIYCDVKSYALLFMTSQRACSTIKLYFRSVDKLWVSIFMAEATLKVYPQFQFWFAPRNRFYAMSKVTYPNFSFLTILQKTIWGSRVCRHRTFRHRHLSLVMHWILKPATLWHHTC